MADLVAGDVTVTINERTRVGKRWLYDLSISFGDGVDTYPSGGVPMPDKKTSFGFVNSTIESLMLSDGDADSGIVWKYDATNHKMVGYHADYDAVADGALIPITGAVAATALTATAIGF